MNGILKAANHNGITDMIEVHIKRVDGPSIVIVHKIRGNRYFHNITLRGDPNEPFGSIPTDLKEHPNRVIGFERDEPGECTLLILTDPHVDTLHKSYAIRWTDYQTYESGKKIIMWMQIRLLFVARLKNEDTNFSSTLLPKPLFQLICKMVTALIDADVNLN